MFKTAQGQVMSVPDIAKKIFEFIMSDKTNSYEITVGTDSQNFDRTKMVEVIAVHRKGRGGTYFYNIEFVRRITNLKQKINEETSRSLVVANDLLDYLGFFDGFRQLFRNVVPGGGQERDQPVQAFQDGGKRIFVRGGRRFLFGRRAGLGFRPGGDDDSGGVGIGGRVFHDFFHGFRQRFDRFRISVAGHAGEFFQQGLFHTGFSPFR